MSLEDTLDALILWDEDGQTPPSDWIFPRELLLTFERAPASFSNPAVIRGYLTSLYQGSPTLAGILENLASRGAIRIGRSRSSTILAGNQFEGSSFFSPETRDTNGVIVFDAYVGFSEDQEIWAFNENGELFQMDPRVILAHELGHWGLGFDDTVDDGNGNYPDSLLNDANYDFEGPSVRFENDIADELEIDESDRRQSYGGALTRAQAVALGLELGRSYTRGQIVDIVRLGSLGNDDLDISARTDGKSILAFGFDGEDFVFGADGADHLYGGGDADIIDGGGGDDYLYGGDGDDNISGGTQQLSSATDNDTIYGGDGNDTVEGGAGDDVIYGEDDDDTIYGDDGADRLFGGDGDDTIFADGDDTLIDGGTGRDTIDYSNSADPITLGSVVATAVNFEILVGSDFGDSIELPSNLIFSDDTIEVRGGAGNDAIIGNSADNRLSGGDDDDTISGRGGVDTISGDAGNDTIRGGDENWLLGEGDVLDGGAGNDTIYGEKGNDIIFGESGNDTIIGGLGRDDLFGGSGRDVIDAAQDDEAGLFRVTFADNIWGGSGADIIRTNAGDVFHDPDGADRVFLDGALLTGGEETSPGSGVYEAADGTTYSLVGATLTVSKPGLFGSSDITINNFRNGLAGIRLRDTDDPDRPPRPGRPFPFDGPPISPIIFDLNGDGVQTIGLGVSSVYFDLDGDGRAERTSFASPEDGLLVLDRNGNGTIDDISELFGSETRDGFFELDQFLTGVELNGGVRAENGNLLTEADLRVWRDANSDGVSQADEIFTLEELNIVEIPRVGSTVPLDSTIPVEERPDFFGFDQNGNRISSIGQGFFADGTSFAVADIFFNNDPTAIRPSEGQFDPLVAIIPDLPGGARFEDLRAVANDNEGLRDLVLDVTRRAGSMSGVELRSAVEEILLAWSGVADQDLRSRGQFIDPEPLAVLEAIYGQTYRQTSGTNAGTANPGPSAAHELLQTYNVILDSFVTQFASQIFEAQIGLASIGEMELADAIDSPFASLGELFYYHRQGLATALDFDAMIRGIAENMPDGSNAEKLAYLDLIGSSLTGLRSDQFGAGNEFIRSGRDNVFESALRDAFAVLDDIALREVAIARALGAQRLLGTNDAETLDTQDPSLFRDLDGLSSMIEGGLGRDTLTGGNGGDVYVFSPGDGHDRVEDNGSKNEEIIETLTIQEGGRRGNPGGVDRLVFLDRSISDVRFSIIGLSVLITFEGNANDSVLIPTVLRGRDIGNVVEQLVFQDGMITDVIDRLEDGELDAQIIDVPDGIFTDTELAELEAEGGIEFTSSLPSTPGDDIIVGTSGTDRYLLATGTGSDTITAGYFDTTVDSLLVDFNRDDVIIATDRNGGAGLLVTTVGQSVDQDGNAITVQGPDSVFFTDFALPRPGQQFRYNLRTLRFLDRQGGAFQIVQDVQSSDYVFVPYAFSQVELRRGIEENGVVVNTSSTSANLFVTVAGSIVEDLGRQFSLFSDPGRNFVFDDGRILTSEELARVVTLSNITPDQGVTLNGSVFSEEITGGNQADVINAGAGDDAIDAGSGNDIVVGGAGDDTIVGGFGDDRLVGDSVSETGFFDSSGPATIGSDTYVYSSGEGNDRIADFGTGQVDRDILVLNNLNLNDVVFSRLRENDQRPESQSEVPEFVPAESRVVDSLLINDTATGQTIIVEGQFSNSVFGLEAIQFADGTLLERDEILALVALTDDVSDVSDGTTLSGRGLIYGGAQFSSVVGTSDTFGSSIPLGLISFDQLPEFDTAIFDASSISQTISGIEIVEFRDAISSEIAITRDPAGALVLTLEATGQAVRVENFFFDPTMTDITEVIDRSTIGAEVSLRFVRFADGELITVDDIADRAVLSGTDADDIIEVDGIGGLVAGGLGSDIIEGSENADWIDGGEGDDQLFGNGGDDVFEVRDGDGDDLVDGGRGFDTYDATFSTLAINVSLEDEDPGGGGPIIILSGDLPLGPGDVVTLESADDVALDDGLILSIDPRPVDPIGPIVGPPILSSGIATFADGTVDELTGIERVIGGRADDVISGSSLDETFIGNDGDDQLIGNGGDDTLAGGRGADALDGGEGLDIADYSRARSGVSLSLAAGVGTAGEAEGDTFVSIEDVFGSNFGDSIEGDDESNSITLGRGDDVASGNAGDDLIYGDDGNDIISGDDGDDELLGGAGNDELLGGNGDDLLTGGFGDDLLNGGFGSDVYLIGHENSADVINDAGSELGDTDFLVLTELNADQVEFIRDRDNLIVNFDAFGSVTILGQFIGDGSGVENIEFADGSIIDRDDIVAAAGSRLIGPIFAFDDLGFSGVEGSSISISSDDLLFNDINIDGGALILSDVSDATNGSVNIDSDGNVVFTPLAEFLGVATFNYRATDGFGAFQTASVTIEFVERQGNAAPVVVQPLDDVNSLEDTAFSFVIDPASFADVDGDTLALSASLADGSDLPDWLTFDGAAFAGTPPQDFNGFFDLLVTASDGELSVSDAFRLTIDLANDAPIVLEPLSDQSVLGDNSITFAVPSDNFADIDGDTLTYSATLADGSALPEWLAFDEQSLTFSGTAPSADATLDIRVTASDSSLAVSDDFLLTVNAEDTGGGSSAGFEFFSLNSWYNPAWGGGYNVTFEYTVQPDAIVDGELRAWDILAEYTGPGLIVNGWLDSFNGPASFEVTDGGVRFSTVGQDFQPDLQVGDTFRISIQVDGAPYTPDDFGFEIFDRDPVANLADNSDTLLTVNPTNSWGSGLSQEVSFTNIGSTRIDDWSLVLDAPEGIDFTITNVWNATATVLSNGDVLFEAQSYNEEVAPNASVGFGFNASYTGGGSVQFTADDFNFTDSTGQIFATTQEIATVAVSLETLSLEASGLTFVSDRADRLAQFGDLYRQTVSMADASSNFASVVPPRSPWLNGMGSQIGETLTSFLRSRLQHSAAGLPGRDELFDRLRSSIGSSSDLFDLLETGRRDRVHTGLSGRQVPLEVGLLEVRRATGLDPSTIDLSAINPGRSGERFDADGSGSIASNGDDMRQMHVIPDQRVVLTDTTNTEVEGAAQPEDIGSGAYGLLVPAAPPALAIEGQKDRRGSLYVDFVQLPGSAAMPEPLDILIANRSEPLRDTDPSNAPSSVPANTDAGLARKLMMIRQDMSTFGAKGAGAEDRLPIVNQDYLHFYA